MTNPISDVLKSEVILATGTNTDENHPIIANYVKEAVMRKDVKLLVIDPRTDRLIDAGHIAALEDARHLTPQALADWLAQWTP